MITISNDLAEAALNALRVQTNWYIARCLPIPPLIEAAYKHINALLGPPPEQPVRAPRKPRVSKPPKAWRRA